MLNADSGYRHFIQWGADCYAYVGDTKERTLDADADALLDLSFAAKEAIKTMGEDKDGELLITNIDGVPTNIPVNTDLRAETIKTYLRPSM